MVTTRRVVLTPSASINGLIASSDLCKPAIEVVRLSMDAIVSFRRLLPGFLLLLTDLRVVSDRRRAVSAGVKPALVRGVE